METLQENRFGVREWRRSGYLLAVLALLTLAVTALPTPAGAAEVIVYERGEAPRVADLAAVPDGPDPLREPTPTATAPAEPERRAGGGARAARSGDDSVLEAIERAERKGLIVSDQARSYRRSYYWGRRWAGRLKGSRGRELGAVMRTVRAMAVYGRLTPSRMPAVFKTIDRNVDWWSGKGTPAVASGARIRFKGSRMIWQHYAGRGIHIHPLANFGTANGYWMADTFEADDALKELLDEMVEIASARYGALAWEYYFPFGGGSAPWASGMAQGTGIQAFARAGERFGRSDYLDVARQALGLFSEPTPRGVRVPLGEDGVWYALYSFSPGLRVLNGHLQATIGLHDLAEVLARVPPEPPAQPQPEDGGGTQAPTAPASDGLDQPVTSSGDAQGGGAPNQGDGGGSNPNPGSDSPGSGLLPTGGALAAQAETADSLYRAGLMAAERRIGAYDTGAWSLYARGGREATLEYHKLNRDFARRLCKRANEEPVAVCAIGLRFGDYMKTEPQIAGIHHGEPRGNAPTSVKFWLDKVSFVSVYIKTQGGKVLRSDQRFRNRGTHTVRMKAPSSKGTYRITVTARDLAGNRSVQNAELSVRR